MLNNNLFVKLSNDYYLDDNITNEELVVFVLILKNYNESKELSLISINTILDFMYVNHNNVRIASVVKESIISLIKKKLIKNIYDVHLKQIKNKDICNRDMFYIEIEPCKSDYYPIYDSNLDKIFSYIKTTNIKRFNFVRYYIALQRVVNYYTKGVGYLAQGKCSKLIGKNETISQYNKILQNDLHLIRYCNDYLTPDKHYCTSFFSRYDNEVEFNQFIDEEVKLRGLIKTNKKISNTKRSIRQKINKTEDKQKIEELKGKLNQLEYKLPWENNICNCCGKNKIEEGKDICDSCLERLENSQDRIGE